MPDTENKKRANNPFDAVTGNKSREDGVLRDESNLYGDEPDVPARRRKSGAKAAGKKAAKPEGKAAKAAKAVFGRVVPGKKGKKNTSKKKKPSAGTRVRKVANVRREGQTFKEWAKEFWASQSNGINIFGIHIRLAPLIALAVLFLLGAGVILNNSNIAVLEQTITVVGLPDELEGYRIVVMSDMNGSRFGDEQSLLLRTLNGLRYDALFCLGDMVGKGGNADPFYEFLDGLNNPEKVYFICGDSDPGPFVNKPRGTSGKLTHLVLADWIVGAIDRGANYVDAPMKLPLKTASVWLSPVSMLNLETTTTRAFWENEMKQEEDGYLAGIVRDRDTLPITAYRYNAMQTLYDAQRTMNASDIHISLAHIVPTDEFIYTFEEHSAGERYLNTPELIVAGHYCGGVWRVPLLGAIYVPDSTLPRGGWLPQQDKVKGLSTVGETQVYITGGLSTNGDVPLMPFRIFNGPEITVLTLTSTLPENMLTAE